MAKIKNIHPGEVLFDLKEERKTKGSSINAIKSLSNVKTRTEELSDKIREIELSKVEISQRIEEVQKKLGKVKPVDKSLAG